MGFFPLSGEATKGEKEIFPWITKGTSYFPQEWLSRNGKDKFPHEQRSCEWGNLFLPWLLSHEWGKYDVPWVMNGEIYPSLWLLTTEFTFTFRERKFDHLKFFHSHFRNCKNFLKFIIQSNNYWDNFFLFSSWEWIVNSKKLANKFFNWSYLTCNIHQGKRKKKRFKKLSFQVTF